jgi:pimeloyl-ACP methyl ester carboxylesterase
MSTGNRGPSGTNIVQPAWFKQAVATESETRVFSCDGATISYRHWPNPGRPGVLLVHGHAAHAHWWDFIAPGLTGDYDVAAIDLSGYGESDHRHRYTARGFAREIIQSCETAGLQNPIVVGHSFGGAMTRVAAYLHPRSLAGIILIDSMIAFQRGDRKPPPMPKMKDRHYATLESGMRRFRLRPPQPCENAYIIDYIAAHSLKRTPQGYQFKLDPAVFAKMPADEELPVAADMVRQLNVPVGLIYGKKSRFFPPESIDRIAGLIEPALLTGIEAAHHHVFLDQPLQFIPALQQMLSAIREREHG